jgi:hypothetical protein
MRVMLAAFWVLLLLGTGCASTANLTPSRLKRSPAGLYQFEVAWETKQRSIQTDSIQAFVVVGTERYPMQPTAVVKNRWEATVPVPAGTRHVHYQYRWDFDYGTLHGPNRSSKLSPPYHIEIVD